MEQKNKKILLHACCGICSGYPIRLLKDMGHEVVVYFCNPNLDTEEEFNKRLEAQQLVCKEFNAPLIVEEYNHEEFLDYIKGLENEPERGKRCIKCIELRLSYAAKKAAELKIHLYTTSLVISPHKNFDMISKIGEELSQNTSVDYLPQNFRKQDGFLKTNMIARNLNLYRQSYCGCEFAKNHS